MGYRIGLYLCLSAAFLCLFVWLKENSILSNAVKKTAVSLEEAARIRSRENRRLLSLLQEREGFLYKVEQRLLYSGIAVKLPWMTPQLWILLNLAAGVGVYFLVLLLGRSMAGALLGTLLLQLMRYVVESVLMSRNYRAVNEDLMKFLDFLGNFSITSGEVTGILNQISRYMEEPLRTVLDECYYEAQTSGDSSLALLTMAEKIEHPRFKELVRNMEMGIRYSADFAELVKNSRRSIREYMRTRQERKSMVTEAIVNMVILAGMSVIILLMVEQLTGISMKTVMLHTLPGKISLSLISGILVLMYRQVRKLNQ